jgi:hypothetical protein
LGGGRADRGCHVWHEQVDQLPPCERFFTDFRGALPPPCPSPAAQERGPCAQSGVLPGRMSRVTARERIDQGASPSALFLCGLRHAEKPLCRQGAVPLRRVSAAESPLSCAAKRSGGGTGRGQAIVDDALWFAATPASPKFGEEPFTRGGTLLRPHYCRPPPLHC